MKHNTLKILIPFFFLTFFGQLVAQNLEKNPEKTVENALTLIQGSAIIAKNINQGIIQLEELAKKNNPKALYILGNLYKKGELILKNEAKAFKYIEKAAKLDYPDAACELGVLYKDGIGCKLDFDTAAMWFKKSYELGCQKGSYSLGYLYFKGLGTIEQDYKKAVHFFSKSEYPMATHWLGICYYFGYGVTKNEAHALELLLGNSYAKNSEILAHHLENNPNLLNLGLTIKNAKKASELDANGINSILEEDNLSEKLEEDIVIDQNSITGKWQGKLVELDWSGEQMMRAFPMELNITSNKNELAYQITSPSGATKGRATLLNNNLSFDKATLQLKRLYQDNIIKHFLDYQLLHLYDIEIKEINNINYLIANVNTRVSDWAEPGPPMLFILNNSVTLTDNGTEINDELLIALAKVKGNNFITSYPNPIDDQLLIQYDLKENTTTSLTVYPIDATFFNEIVKNEFQEKGKHLYHVDTTNFKSGIYVIKITINSEEYTKLIIKE